MVLDEAYEEKIIKLRNIILKIVKITYDVVVKKQNAVTSLLVLFRLMEAAPTNILH